MLFHADPVFSISQITKEYSFIRTWGSLGTGNGQCSFPHGVAIDSSGSVYVTDTRNDRIQKFDSSGRFLTAWSLGTTNGQDSFPIGLAIDSSGNVYVAYSYYFK
jgi:tripartite motif-containing protein 71